MEVSKKEFNVNGNFPKLLVKIAEHKKQVRAALPDCKIRFNIRGRGDRKNTFAKTGRFYSKYSANQNDVGITQTEAPYMRAFVVYTYISDSYSNN